ncbi:UNVERIFIED_CONTAM: hypothetical protein Slati_3983000 [Sesamum latifolium]|uniref:Uncharacterized protein n=1 Tax=Sesamum latifolium TaxID=2727402 RepID=A0AAW2TSZ1_9LAMI
MRVERADGGGSVGDGAGVRRTARPHGVTADGSCWGCGRRRRLRDERADDAF